MTHNSSVVAEFPNRYGTDAGRILHERYSKVQPYIDSEAIAAYREVFSEEEMTYISQFYETERGRQILRKYDLLYPKLAEIGAAYALKVMSSSEQP